MTTEPKRKPNLLRCVWQMLTAPREVEILRELNADQAATIKANRIASAAAKALHKAAVRELQEERDLRVVAEMEANVQRERAEQAEALVASMRAHPSRHEGEEQ